MYNHYHSATMLPRVLSHRFRCRCLGSATGGACGTWQRSINVLTPTPPTMALRYNLSCCRSMAARLSFSIASRASAVGHCSHNLQCETRTAPRLAQGSADTRLHGSQTAIQMSAQLSPDPRKCPLSALCTGHSDTGIADHPAATHCRLAGSNPWCKGRRRERRKHLA